MIINTGTLTPSEGIILQGAMQGDFFGQSVSHAGDVNGDGIDDVIIGASRGDTGAINSGEAYILFGGNDFADIDLNTLDSTQGILIYGDTLGGFAGFSVSHAGDVNGDGIDDVIIGRPHNDTGEAHIIYGGMNLTDIDLRALTAEQGITISGVSIPDEAGTSVSGVGDVNGDGIDDVIIGAPQGNDNNTGQSGEAYVVFGGNNLTNIDLRALTAEQGFTIDGDAANDGAGWSVSGAGDVNGDGIHDLIVGSPFGDDGGATAGEAYIIFGGNNLTDINLGTLTPSQGIIIRGDAGDTAGRSVSDAGDVNGDGIDDIIIGAPGFNNGEAYIIFGGNTLSDIDLHELTSTQGVIIQGSVGIGVGSSVASAGDINGDGLDDVIISSFTGSAFDGEAYIIFGSENLDANIDLGSLDPSQGLTLVIPDEFIFDGSSTVSGAGDLNNDGIDDFIIGLRSANGAGAFATGEAIIVFGQNSFGENSVAPEVEVLTGTNGDDVIDITMMTGVDEVNTLEGDDLIIISSGDNNVIEINGGDGRDTVRLETNSFFPQIEANTFPDFLDTPLLLGLFDEGADLTLTSIERLEFVAPDDQPGLITSLVEIGGIEADVIDISALSFSESFNLVFVVAGGGNDLILGSDDAGLTVLGSIISLAGGNGDDIILDGSVDSTLRGEAGDDIITGNGGDDLINGGEGTDIAVFNGSLLNYTTFIDEDGDVTITDNVGSDGVDTLLDIEFLQFTDQTISIDALSAEVIDDDFAGDTSTTGVLEVDGSAMGSIEVQGDVDFFAIELTAGELVRISASDGSFSINLSLQDELGNIVSFGNSDFNTGDAFVLADVEVSGTYFVSVESFDSVDYTLSAEVIVDDFAGDTSTTGVLEVDGTAMGSLEYQGDVDFFAIQLTAGELVRISAPDYSFNMFLSLHDELGNFVSFGGNDFNSSEAFVFADVEVSGTYFVSVESFDSVDYTLSAEVIDDDFAGDTSTTGVLEVDGTVMGSLDFGGDVDFFAIELTAGELVRIAAPDDLELSLRDEFGNFVSSSDYNFNTGEAFVLADVEASGTYFVSVESFAFSPDYTLSAEVIVDDFAGNASTTGVLEIDGTATGSLEYQGDVDFFAIELTAGELVRISALDVFFSLELSLQDEFGNTVSFGDNDFNSGEAFVLADVELSGTYFVSVDSFDFFTDYTLSAEAIGNRFITGLPGDDILLGTTGDNVINGLGGDDVITTLSGDDTVNAGGGNDTIIININGSGSIVGGAGQDLIQMEEGLSATFINQASVPEVTIFTNAGSYSVTGVERIETLDASGNINDLLLVGNASVNVFDLTGEGPAIATILAGGAADIVTANDNGSTLQVDLGNGDDVFNGGSGFSDITTGLGSDIINGGTGYDSVRYFDSAEGITINLDGSAGIGGTAQGDTLFNVEEVFATSFDDTIIGSSADEVFWGGFAGDDVVNGGGGDDLLFLSNGNMVLTGGAGADVFSIWSFFENIFDGEITDFSSEDTISISADSSLFIGVSTFNNIIGEIRYEHIAGQTVLQLDDTGDGIANHFLTISSGELDLALTNDLDIFFELIIEPNLILGTSMNDTLNGGDGSDTLYGQSGDDILNGGAGDDILTGASGRDFLNGGAGADEINGGGGNDTINGGAGDDILFGSIGEDLINGGDGADIINGGNQHDMLLGDSGDDALTGGAGNDSLDGGSGNDALVGGAGADTLMGGDGNDTLEGNSGGDDLFGGNGTDILFGGGGNDDLYGEAGADTFVFTAAIGVDRIKDFEDGVDTIDLSGFVLGNDFADVMDAATQVGANVRLDFNANNSIVIENFNLADLDETDFIF